MQVVGARLEEARKLRGMSQTKLSRLIGTSPSQVSMIEHDQSGTSMRSAIAAAKVLNVSLDYLVGFARDPRPAGELATLVGRQTAGELDQKVMEEDHDEADVEDFVGVHEIIASAGTGSEVINERITDRIKFRRPWMRRLGLQASQCRIAKVIGESMEPTLPDGASILVNMGERNPRDGRIFVVRIEDEIVVKRVIQNSTAGWLLQSDNRNKQAWPTRPWPADAQIVGMVRWVARTLT